VLQSELADLAVDPGPIYHDGLLVRPKRRDDGCNGDVVQRTARDLCRCIQAARPNGKGPDGWAALEAGCLAQQRAAGLLVRAPAKRHGGRARIL
jgi:hypothetical protein